MSEEKKTEKPATVGFMQSLGDLLDAAKQIAESVPGVIAEVSPMLPKELQPKKPSVLPAEIAITFRTLDVVGWAPLTQGPAEKGDMVGRYRLVSEAEWGEPPPGEEPQKP